MGRRKGNKGRQTKIDCPLCRVVGSSNLRQESGEEARDFVVVIVALLLLLLLLGYPFATVVLAAAAGGRRGMWVERVAPSEVGIGHGLVGKVVENARQARGR